MVLISVIVPIYKVENFIGRCVDSLMKQSLRQGVEYIFVDDCSPDKSMLVLNEVLNSYPERKSNILIIKHKENKGLPSARNTGMQYASGKYIYHCDSDDYLEDNALELLLQQAESLHADIVWCDWFLTFSKNERYMKQPVYFTPDEALKGILKGHMKYNVWNKLVLHSLYTENGILFPDGHGMGEDMTMIRLFACASKIAYLPTALYHYVKTNNEAYTTSFSHKALSDIQWNDTKTIDFLLYKKGESILCEINCFKLNVKYPFLISDRRDMYELWQTWFPESNSYIFRNNGSIRSRLLQYAASKRLFWLIRLHYFLVYRFVYGIIYR